MNFRTLVAIPAIAAVIGLGPVPLVVQVPGSGWLRSPGPARQVRRLFWKEFGETEAFVTLQPLGVNGSGVPATLVFFATVAGDVALPFGRAHRATSIQLEAQPSPMALVVSTTLVFREPDKASMDLVASGLATFLPAGCDNCASRSLQVRLDAAWLKRLSSAERLDCEVLGFPCTLDARDTAALADFGRAIGFWTE